MSFTKYTATLSVMFAIFVFAGLGQSISVEEICKSANEITEHIEVFDKPIPLKTRRARVMTEGGSSVSEASVIILNSVKRNVLWNGKTSKYGRFNFPKLMIGSYLLVICKPGYDTSHLKIVVRKKVGALGEIIVRMSPL
jgi:hypothetical protein